MHILNDLLCAQYKAYGGSSGGSRSSKHGHHRESKSAQNSDAKTALFGESVEFYKKYMSKCKNISALQKRSAGLRPSGSGRRSR